MIEQFDKQLRDHIKDTLDVYDDLMEHDGWLKYQRKVKRKKYGLIFLWSLPSGIAAALALVWLLNGTLEKVDTKTEIAKNNSSTLEDKSIPDLKIASPNLSVERNIIVKTELTKKVDYAKNNTGLINNIHQEKADNVLESNSIVTNPENYLANTIIVNNTLETPNLVTEKSLIKENNETIVIAKNEETLASSISSFKNQIKETKEFNNSFSDLAASSYVMNDEKTKEKVNSKKLKLGLDASTFMNFTKDGMSQDMNLGVGLASELKISKNFSINSGININKQSASYANNNTEIRNNESFKQSAPLSGLTTAMAAPVVRDISYDAKLVGFDIPLAIKYSSNNKNLNWFISTGFSSYTLLTETYANNISTENYGLNGLQTTNEVITEEVKEDPFSNLQLARTLNFSIGFTFPLKDITSIAVEPFVKYPLRGFGREDLTIGSSGVSLKLNLDRRIFK